MNLSALDLGESLQRSMGRDGPAEPVLESDVQP